MSVFIAIIVIQAVIPFLGFIPIGAMNASLIQVTVAIGAILLGPKMWSRTWIYIWASQYLEEYFYAKSNIILLFSVCQHWRISRGY